MIILGLTGGIGMGKSTVAEILRGFGLPIYNADKVVHGLVGKGGKGVKPVGRLFQDVVRRDAIDRKKLGRMVFDDRAKLKKLEKILHPLVRSAEKKFLVRVRAQKKPAAVL